MSVRLVLTTLASISLLATYTHYVLRDRAAIIGTMQEEAEREASASQQGAGAPAATGAAGALATAVARR